MSTTILSQLLGDGIMTDMRNRLRGYLSELRLATVRDHFEALAQQASQDSWSYEEYLLGLIEAEHEQRAQSRIERCLHASKLPLEKSLESFDLARLPKRVLQQFKTLLRGDFLDRRENLLVFGAPGSGKTHMVCALGQELIRSGRKVLMTKCGLLVQALLLAKKELRLGRLIKRMAGYDALIIDDLGYVQQNQKEMDALFTLLSERYERGSILLTSNLPFSKWGRIFKDPMMTAAAIDRLVHHSIVIELNLKSYRMEYAKAAQS